MTAESMECLNWCVLFVCLAVAGSCAEELRWVDARDLTIEGKGWTDTAAPYDRLPARAEGVVPPSVWSLSHHSAGLCLRFISDARSISARWTLLSENLSMLHMAATGVSGLDLYARPLPSPSGTPWRWVANGRPEHKTNEQSLVWGLPEGNREYLLYLPLYNGVTSVEIGVPLSATLTPAPPRGRPIVFYGTSITQGGCAARPGMAYPAILGRRLDWPTINLGFSGSAQMEPAVANLLAELEPCVYVLDALPNMGPDLVAERAPGFINILRAAHPNTPIVLVENITYQGSWVYPEPARGHTAKNLALRKVYEDLLAAGVQGLHYVPGSDLLGADTEATVDGTHATDLGFLRMAEALWPVLARLVR